MSRMMNPLYLLKAVNDLHPRILD